MTRHGSQRPDRCANPITLGGLQWLIPALLVLFFLAPLSARAQQLSAATTAEAAVDRYRQLSLLLIVSEGIEASFLEGLLTETADEEDNAQLSQFNIDDFQTPLNRIVNQRAVIAHAARLFQYTRQNESQIKNQMTQLLADYPETVGAIDPDVVTEEAIIIRTGLAGSMEFTGVAEAAGPAKQLQAYQERTVFLRNMMEYRDFRQDLSLVTDDALRDTGGRLDAYQRMLEADSSLDAFGQRMEAIDFMYQQITGRLPRMEEVERDALIEAESQVR